MFPIPANATRIRYLESTRTQWINAGVTPDGNTAIDSVWTIPTTSSGTLCGGRTSGSEGQFYVWARPGHTNPNQAWRFGYGTVNADFGPASAYTTPMRVSFGPGYAKFGSAEETFSSQTFTGTRFYIFALCNGASSSSDRTPLKLHWLKIWQSGALVRDFIPVRVGQVGYLFDRVSGQLFGNAGTGDFVLGPDTFHQGVVPTRMMAMGLKNMPTSWNYVYSGLVAMWDGIENAGRGKHDASSAVWKDLIGTRDFTVSLTNAEWEKDALYAKNRNAATMDAVPFSSGYTVQFVVKQLYSGSGNSAYVILGLDGTRYYGLLHRPAVGALMCDSAYFTNSATAGYRCLSFSDITNTTASMWADGSVVSANGYNSLDYTSSRGNVARIGGSGDSNRSIKIQAIRIYSRALTDTEIAHNYAIDKARFNLP